jgi:predicted membrane GTPase involved in stress response
MNGKQAIMHIENNKMVEISPSLLRITKYHLIDAAHNVLILDPMTHIGLM